MQDTIQSTSPTERVMHQLANKQDPTSPKDFGLKFAEPRQYPASTHLDVLASPKPAFHPRDFFLTRDFRGLFLADNQEAIGERAFACVDDLNRTVLTQFKGLHGFNEAIQQRKQAKRFYQEELIPRIREEKRRLKEGGAAGETQAAYFNSTGLKSEMTKYPEVSLVSERTGALASQ